MHANGYNMLLKVPKDRVIDPLGSDDGPQLGRQCHGRQKISPLNQKHITQ